VTSPTREPYSAPISRANPSCFLFLIDQSKSMSEPFGDAPRKRKAEGVADAINHLLHDLVLRCAKGEGIRNYYEVGVVGYGGAGARPALGGPLAGRALVPLSDLACNPVRVEQRTRKEHDGAGGLVERLVKFPVWFEPVAEGRTPMCRALEQAGAVVSGFLLRHPHCYPPVVLNLSDGEATDGDPEPAAAALRQLASTDGNVLLFNAHISARRGRPVEFPAVEADLPDERARRLFRMSSLLPPQMQAEADAEGFRISAASRGFVFNASLTAVIGFLNIGTRNNVS
jgi:hypothetical protein